MVEPGEGRMGKAVVFVCGQLLVNQDGTKKVLRRKKGKGRSKVKRKLKCFDGDCRGAPMTCDQ